MAYSDYGGYAYRNGVRVVERSDATINPGGNIFGTPGMWPGFGMLLAGVPVDEVRARTEWPHGHAVLGDGPIYVTLYKQSSLHIYRLAERLDELELLVDGQEYAIGEGESSGEKFRYLDVDYFLCSDEDKPCVFEVDGWCIEVYFLMQDNYYMYVKATQPDSNVWHGWSGYGVGAGLEDCGYGYSTAHCEYTLKRLWPGEIEE